MVLQASMRSVPPKCDCAKRFKPHSTTHRSDSTWPPCLGSKGRYPQAVAACERVFGAGATFYATACQTKVKSLQGTDVSKVRPALLAQASQPDAQAWLLGDVQVRQQAREQRG